MQCYVLIHMIADIYYHTSKSADQPSFLRSTETHSDETIGFLRFLMMQWLANPHSASCAAH